MATSVQSLTRRLGIEGHELPARPHLEQCPGVGERAGPEHWPWTSSVQAFPQLVHRSLGGSRIVSAFTSIWKSVSAFAVKAARRPEGSSSGGRLGKSLHSVPGNSLGTRGSGLL
jgi:hypothetical protein